jgi:hypothetical protein
MKRDEHEGRNDFWPQMRDTVTVAGSTGGEAILSEWGAKGKANMDGRMSRTCWGLFLVSALTLLTVLPLNAAADSRAISAANDQFHQTWQRTDEPVEQGLVSRTWMWGPQTMSSPDL